MFRFISYKILKRPNILFATNLFSVWILILYIFISALVLIIPDNSDKYSALVHSVVLISFFISLENVILSLSLQKRLYQIKKSISTYPGVFAINLYLKDYTLNKTYDENVIDWVRPINKKIVRCYNELFLLFIICTAATAPSDTAVTT